VDDSIEKGSTGKSVNSFYSRPQVQVDEIPIGGGVPLGIERISNPQIGIGGAYGAWGESYDNSTLPDLIERVLGEPLGDEEKMDLDSLGFVSRHHVSELTAQEHIQVEVSLGARLLKEAAYACGWEPEEVDAVCIGITAPVADDYTQQIAQQAGVPDQALKLTVHKACDGSVGALHMALNPILDIYKNQDRNIANELHGKKVLVGGIEGLSRFILKSGDKFALQLFGNGAGMIGVIPGETVQFLAGKTHESYDEMGVLAVHMYYPHSGNRVAGQSMVELTQIGKNQFRIAGLMHEPEGETPVVMAGPMGMVKLFVRSGVEVVRELYREYQSKMDKIGEADKSIAVAIVHHANYKINKLKDKHLQREGIHLKMPWLLSDFGNVSAASNMIAFLRYLSKLKPGDHVLFDGFGAGTYYDALAVMVGAG